MPKLAVALPFTPIEPVTELLHGVTITDPYRWLEDQDSPRTREWIRLQQEHARSYLESIPGRERIRERIRELLDVETYDSVQKAGNKYFFRKRLPGQEQPCIYFRQVADGKDQLLIDPASRGTGSYTAVKPLLLSPDGRLLLYEVKEGGERTSTFELLDIESRTILPDILPHGYLRGFAFAPHSKSFYYVLESAKDEPHNHRVSQHVIGTSFNEDEEIFSTGNSGELRLQMTSGGKHLGFLVLHFGDTTLTDFYIWSMGSNPPELVIREARYKFGPLLVEDGRILAITDLDAPNLRIVDVRPRPDQIPEFRNVIPQTDAVIQNWTVADRQVLVSYFRDLKTSIVIFDLEGNRIGNLPVEADSTVRFMAGFEESEELLFEQESFTEPVQISRYSPKNDRIDLWAKRTVPFDSSVFSHREVRFTAKDGVSIPMYVVGRWGVLESGSHPTIMTSYGGYGIPMTPQFSVFVAYLMEQGCLFALPNIRGGSEFGIAWHEAAKRKNRQVAFDDFISAAEWLIRSGHTEPDKLAIFGGSNSGLLAGAAMTQRPDLFRAVLCMVPMLDMLRYHLFDNALAWKDELGTAGDPDDFAALRAYSPYHNVRERTAYPATMIVSGDSDQNCDPMHARKMMARLQAANISDLPIFLDYSCHRGHSPVLPLSERVDALRDRLAFLCDQLSLSLY